MQEQPPSSTAPSQLSTAELDWQGTNVPVAIQFGDIYFSGQQGLQETEYIFLQHNRLQQRWQQLDPNSNTQKTIFTIAETGFGTGLNFLAAWRLWQQHAPSNWQLHFVSVEKHPLRQSDLQRALSSWPELEPLSLQLINEYPVLLPGHHLLKFDQGRVNLHLLLGDACDGLQQLRCSDLPALAANNISHVDAWFLDGFSPAKNPSLWNDRLYSLIAQLSAPGTTLATFTAAGDVRRSLSAQGFEMAKDKGFGHKREMLMGVFCGPQTIASPINNTRKTVKKVIAPWYVNRQKTGPRHVTIIGGGLAGTTSAYAMAQRGWQVTLIERQTTLAQGASGNPQGMLYTKLSAEPGKLNQFTLSSYLFALRFYRQLASQQRLSPQQLDFCGVLQLARTEKERKLLAQLQQQFSGQAELVQFLDSQQASAIAGIELAHPSWYFPQAGWLSPVDLCHSLVKHPLISIQYNSDVLTLDYQQQSQQWQLQNAAGASIASSAAVIIANSRDANQFQQTQSLPLKTIRGQITRVASSGSLAQLKTVVCHEGYLTPAINGHHCLGATFDNNDSDTTVRSEDHQHNLDSLLQAVPSLSPDINAVNTNELTGRASLRCASPDYLPMVGPVHDYQQFLEDYAPLTKDAHSPLSTTGSYYPGLYINVAHGSRGLTSTPLCSELLAAIICNEIYPLPRDLSTALNPARFVIRDLIRHKI